jgi:hypothetical protein
MPYKLRNNRRHKFKKTIYKITNWREYNQALINRGSITLWLSPEIIKAWRPKKRKQKLALPGFVLLNCSYNTLIFKVNPIS